MSIPLENISGVTIHLKSNEILFPSRIKHDKVEKRYYKGNEAFFCGIEKNTFDKSIPLYYIYRNVGSREHIKLFKKHGFRYDITVLAPSNKVSKINFKKEHGAVRTIGHIHKILSKNKRPDEKYQVLSGKAIFYLQHIKEKKSIFISASKGSLIDIPGSFGHITINASQKDPLVIANIFIDKKNSSDYSFFKKTGGPAFFPVWRNGKIHFVNNYKLNGYSTIKKTAKKSTSIYKSFIKTYK